MYVCMYVCTCVTHLLEEHQFFRVDSLGACMYVCIYIYMYVYMYVCMCVTHLLEENQFFRVDNLCHGYLVVAAAAAVDATGSVSLQLLLPGAILRL